MSEHDGRPTDWSKLLRPYLLLGEAMRDRIAALEHELAERDRRIAHLESLLPQAFDAGVARGIASHRDFEQVHPDRDAWVHEALGKDEETR